MSAASLDARLRNLTDNVPESAYFQVGTEGSRRHYSPDFLLQSQYGRGLTQAYPDRTGPDMSNGLRFVVTTGRDQSASGLVLKAELYNINNQLVAQPFLRHHERDNKAAKVLVTANTPDNMVQVHLSFEILIKSAPIYVRISIVGLEAQLDRVVQSRLLFTGSSGKMPEKAKQYLASEPPSPADPGTLLPPGTADPYFMHHQAADPARNGRRLPKPEAAGGSQQMQVSRGRKRAAREASGASSFLDLWSNAEDELLLSDVILYLTQQQAINVLTEEEKRDYLGNFFRCCNPSRQTGARTNQQVLVDYKSAQLFEKFFCGRGIVTAFQMVKEVYQLDYFHRFLPREGSLSLLHLTSKMVGGRRGQFLLRFSGNSLSEGKLALDALRVDETGEYSALVAFDPTKDGWIIGNGQDASGRPKAYSSLASIAELNKAALTQPISFRGKISADYYRQQTAPYRENFELSGLSQSLQLANLADRCGEQRWWTTAPVYDFQFVMKTPNWPSNPATLEFKPEQRSPTQLAFVAAFGTKSRLELLVSVHPMVPRLDYGEHIQAGTMVISQVMRQAPFEALLSCSIRIEGLLAAAQVKVTMAGSDAAYVVSEPFLDEQLALFALAEPPPMETVIEDLADMGVEGPASHHDLPPHQEYPGSPQFSVASFLNSSVSELSLPPTDPTLAMPEMPLYRTDSLASSVPLPASPPQPAAVTYETTFRMTMGPPSPLTMGPPTPGLPPSTSLPTPVAAPVPITAASAQSFPSGQSTPNGAVTPSGSVSSPSTPVQTTPGHVSYAAFCGYDRYAFDGEELFCNLCGRPRKVLGASTPTTGGWSSPGTPGQPRP